MKQIPDKQQGFAFLVTSHTREEGLEAMPLLKSFDQSEQDKKLHQLPARFSYQYSKRLKRVSLDGEPVGDVVFIPEDNWNQDYGMVRDVSKPAEQRQPYVERLASFATKIIDGIELAYKERGARVFGLGGHTSIALFEELAQRNAKGARLATLNDLVNQELAQRAKEKDFEIRGEAFCTPGSNLTVASTTDVLSAILKEEQIDIEKEEIVVYGFGSIGQGCIDVIRKKYECVRIIAVRGDKERLNSMSDRTIKSWEKKGVHFEHFEAFEPTNYKLILAATSQLQPILHASRLTPGVIVFDNGRPASLSKEDIRKIHELGGRYLRAGLFYTDRVDHGLRDRFLTPVSGLTMNEVFGCFAESFTLMMMLRHGIPDKIRQKYKINGSDSDVVKRFCQPRINRNLMGLIRECSAEYFTPLLDYRYNESFKERYVRQENVMARI